MLFRFLCVVAAVLFAGPVQAQYRTSVMVGVYEYSVIHFYQNGVQTGFAHDLIDRLNRIQDTYKFVAVETSPRRRYQDMAMGNIDMVLLQNPDWNWSGRGVDFSTPIVREYDLLVALRDRVYGPAYFEEILEYSLAGVLGFHYRFVDFVADPQELERILNVSLLYNESEVLEAVMRKDADVGIVSAGFISRQFRQVEGIGEKIAIGPRADNSYPLVAVISRKAPLTVERFDTYLDALRASNQIAPLWSNWHRGVLP
ncbi:transporter substrate-binding domain-containing protein [Thalassospira profundimaris]|uniref:transporter substrate-binding domain-containing protein n=1 Tax=Thalassospira profundimaris TaxID=502049 RepID=UPI0015EFECE7|nr:transporter substrate-binding domain-containing protein [Thalassospira profundimaris]